MSDATIEGRPFLAPALVEVESIVDDLGLAIGPTCRMCGCTRGLACEGGCSWVEQDLCSACVPVMDGLAVFVEVTQGTPVPRVNWLDLLPNIQPNPAIVPADELDPWVDCQACDEEGEIGGEDCHVCRGMGGWYASERKQSTSGSENG